ncbi:MAG: MT-A70 family methyltransferase [Nostoc sp.]|uniref:MT-A70 family methyltransferase n=1 Tax=Nostoc sp. TaxID=1180 RepID=UPI002FF55946
MSFIRTKQENGTNYYYIIESKRYSSVKTPRQNHTYLGKYEKACETIEALNIPQSHKEEFLKKIKEEEEKLKAKTYNISDKKYNCIVIDPPWFYNLRKDDVTHRNRIPYPPMKIEEILLLPIPELCDKQGTVLWLWFTNNHLLEAAECIKHWGFELKTILTWEKVSKKGTTRIGTGHWLRNSTEHCILAVRGHVTSFSHSKKLTNEPTILKAPRREHSRKPEEFYELVNHLCNGTKLEMFARQKREGWDVWGNEIDKFDNQSDVLYETVVEVQRSSVLPV